MITRTVTRTYTLERTLRVRTRREGFHAWPEAPEAVDFLRTRHRHEFHVELEVTVNHADRELEFMLLKWWLEDTLATIFGDDGELGTKSCEHVALMVVEAAIASYGSERDYACTVAEDGENGATVRARMREDEL